MVLAGNKAKRLQSANNTTKTIHHHSSSSKTLKRICGNLFKLVYDISLLFTVSHFLFKVLRKPDDGRNRNLEIFQSSFSRRLQICYYQIVKCTIKFCKGLPTMVGQQKKFIILRILFLQKINVGRENTNSQWLISFWKIQPCKLFLQAKGNVSNLVLIEEQK